MTLGDLPIVADALSDDAIARELARRAARYGSTPAGDAAATRTVLVWALGAERYATPVSEIWATMAAAKCTAVPGAPAALIGVFSRQGVIHNLFDPAPALGAGGGAGGNYVIILRQERPRIAIRVDETIAIVEVPETAFGDGRTIVDDAPVTIVDTSGLIARLTAGAR